MFVTARRFFSKTVRPFEERNKFVLNQHKHKRLVLARRAEKPNQFVLPKPPIEPEVRTVERKLPPLVEQQPPYKKYTQEEIDRYEGYGTYYDPLFNPHLYDKVHQVNPDEEPFNAIYADSQAEEAKEFTKVRNITTPELWDFVERLARIKMAPLPQRRKAGEPVKPLPSGFVPPPETPPDLPYFIARTRNHLVPVYYNLHKDPVNCYTIIRKVSGDIWKLEEDLRTHLESLNEKRQKILSSVHETDECVLFRGRYVHQVVDWLHEKGF